MYTLTKIWVVDNNDKVVNLIDRRIYKRKDKNIVRYLNKYYKTYYYHPKTKLMAGYCIFPRGLTARLKKSLNRNNR